MPKSIIRRPPVVVLKVISVLFFLSAVQTLQYMANRIQFGLGGFVVGKVVDLVSLALWFVVNGCVGISIWRKQIKGFYLGISIYVLQLSFILFIHLFPEMATRLLQIKFSGTQVGQLLEFPSVVFVVWWFSAIGALWAEIQFLKQK